MRTNNQFTAIMLGLGTITIEFATWAFNSSDPSSSIEFPASPFLAACLVIYVLSKTPSTAVDAEVIDG